MGTAHSTQHIQTHPTPSDSSGDTAPIPTTPAQQRQRRIGSREKHLLSWLCTKAKPPHPFCAGTQLDYKDRGRWHQHCHHTRPSLSASPLPQGHSRPFQWSFSVFCCKLEYLGSFLPIHSRSKCWLNLPPLRRRPTRIPYSRLLIWRCPAHIAVPE